MFTNTIIDTTGQCNYLQLHVTDKDILNIFNVMDVSMKHHKGYGIFNAIIPSTSTNVKITIIVVRKVYADNNECFRVIIGFYGVKCNEFHTIKYETKARRLLYIVEEKKGILDIGGSVDTLDIECLSTLKISYKNLLCDMTQLYTKLYRKIDTIMNKRRDINE